MYNVLLDAVSCKLSDLSGVLININNIFVISLLLRVEGSTYSVREFVFWGVVGD